MGDTVKLSADVEGYEDGTKAHFEIWEKDLDGTDDFIIKIEKAVQGKKVEAEWTYEYREDTDDVTEEDEQRGYSAPEYYFVVKVGNDKGRSGLLLFQDWIEIELKDMDGKPMANEEYVLYFSNGETRKGKLDANGKKREEKVPPISHRVEFLRVRNALRID